MLTTLLVGSIAFGCGYYWRGVADRRRRVIELQAGFVREGRRR